MHMCHTEYMINGGSFNPINKFYVEGPGVGFSLLPVYSLRHLPKTLSRNVDDTESTRVPPLVFREVYQTPSLPCTATHLVRRWSPLSGSTVTAARLCSPRFHHWRPGQSSPESIRTLRDCKEDTVSVRRLSRSLRVRYRFSVDHPDFTETVIYFFDSSRPVFKHGPLHPRVPRTQNGNPGLLEGDPPPLPPYSRSFVYSVDPRFCSLDVTTVDSCR